MMATMKPDRNCNLLPMFACNVCDNKTSESGKIIYQSRICSGSSLKPKHSLCANGKCGKLLKPSELIVHGAIGLPTSTLSICFSCFNEGTFVDTLKRGKSDPSTDFHELMSHECYRAKFGVAKGCTLCGDDIKLVSL